MPDRGILRRRGGNPFPVPRREAGGRGRGEGRFRHRQQPRRILHSLCSLRGARHAGILCGHDQEPVPLRQPGEKRLEGGCEAVLFPGVPADLLRQRCPVPGGLQGPIGLPGPGAERGGISGSGEQEAASGIHGGAGGAICGAARLRAGGGDGADPLHCAKRLGVHQAFRGM